MNTRLKTNPIFPDLKTSDIPPPPTFDQIELMIKVTELVNKAYPYNQSENKQIIQDCINKMSDHFPSRKEFEELFYIINELNRLVAQKNHKLTNMIKDFWYEHIKHENRIFENKVLKQAKKLYKQAYGSEISQPTLATDPKNEQNQHKSSKHCSFFKAAEKSFDHSIDAEKNNAKITHQRNPRV